MPALYCLGHNHNQPCHLRQELLTIEALSRPLRRLCLQTARLRLLERLSESCILQLCCLDRLRLVFELFARERHVEIKVHTRRRCAERTTTMMKRAQTYADTSVANTIAKPFANHT